MLPPMNIYATNFYGYSNISETKDIRMIDMNGNEFSYNIMLLKESVDLDTYVSTRPFGLKCHFNKLYENIRLYILTVVETRDLTVDHQITVVNKILEKIQRKKLNELSQIELTYKQPIFIQYHADNIYTNCHDLLQNFVCLNIVYINKHAPTRYAYYETTTIKNCIDYKSRKIRNESNELVDIPIYMRNLMSPEKSKVLSLRNFTFRNNRVLHWALTTYDGSGRFELYETSKTPSDIPVTQWSKINIVLRIPSEFKATGVHLACLKLDNLIFWLSTLHTMLSADDENIYFDDEQLLNFNGLTTQFSQISSDDMSYSFTDFNTLPICQIMRIQNIFKNYKFYNIQYTEKSIYAFDDDQSTMMFIGVLSNDILNEHVKNFENIKF